MQAREDLGLHFKASETVNLSQRPLDTPVRSIDLHFYHLTGLNQREEHFLVRHSNLGARYWVLINALMT
jgi:hypothetical protein